MATAARIRYHAAMSAGDSILAASKKMAARLARFKPRDPVRYIYNPLAYAFEPYAHYTLSFASKGVSALFIGMNPGPWGMAQTGVPFGEIAAVRDWMGISGYVRAPSKTHPRVPILGFASRRSEASGRRFWGLARERFGTARRFFANNFVINYCPLMFLDGRGGNVTPDKLDKADREKLFRICDDFLGNLIRILEPARVVGIGSFARMRAQFVIESLGGLRPSVTGIIHPSPANPRANRDWAGTAERELERLGIWKRRVKS